MTARRLVRYWNRFFFAPCPPTAIALYRIFFGVLLLADMALLWPDLLVWYGEKGAVTLDTARSTAIGTRLNLFALLPPGDFWVWLFFAVFVLFACFLTIGLFTRLSTVIVFVGLVSIHHRNLFILNSGDSLLRLTSFLLMFAPCGAALSVDRWKRIRRGQEGPEPPLHSPWAQRLIQIQIAIAYFSTFYWKTQGSMWIDGTALYYVSHIAEFKRFPVPFLFDNLWLIKAATWFTLLTEFSLAVLVWIKELRYYVLAAGVLLHLGIEWSMNIPLFEWIFIATYITFVEPAHLDRSWQWLRRRLHRRRR